MALEEQQRMKNECCAEMHGREKATVRKRLAIQSWFAIKPQLYHQSTLDLSLFAVDAH